MTQASLVRKIIRIANGGRKLHATDLIPLSERIVNAVPLGIRINHDWINNDSIVHCVELHTRPREFWEERVYTFYDDTLPFFELWVRMLCDNILLINDVYFVNIKTYVPIDINGKKQTVWQHSKELLDGSVICGVLKVKQEELIPAATVYMHIREMIGTLIRDLQNDTNRTV